MILGMREVVQAVGIEWKSIFDLVLTREFRYVKPDKRLLEWVASEWNVDPHSLLMVGDSREDIEVGAYSGAMTCHFDENNTQVGIHSNTLNLSSRARRSRQVGEGEKRRGGGRKVS